MGLRAATIRWLSRARGPATALVPWERGQPRWRGPTSDRTAWEHDEPAANDLHPTHRRAASRVPPRGPHVRLCASWIWRKVRAAAPIHIGAPVGFASPCPSCRWRRRATLASGPRFEARWW